MTGSSFSGTLSKVTSAQTINATFGVDEMAITPKGTLINTENANTVMPSSVTVQYSTNNSTWQTLATFTRSGWTLVSGKIATWQQNKTAVNIPAGSSLYLRLSSSISPNTCHATGRVGILGTQTVLTTTGQLIGTVSSSSDVYIAFGFDDTNITVTVGANGKVTLTSFHWSENSYQPKEVTNETFTTKVNYGSDVSYTVEPDTDYAIDTLTVNGVDPR